MRDISGSNNPNWRNAAHRVCEQCGESYKSYQKGRRFCSRPCYAKSRETLKAKKCKNCGEKFQPNTTARQFCGHSCAKEARKSQGRKCPYCDKAMANNPKVQTCGDKKCRRKHFVASGSTVEKLCKGCKALFISAKSAGRKYCSYACFIDNGGAQLAGKASKRAVRTYGAKKDANHKEIVDALERVGVGVIDTSHVGGGFPDLICGRRGQNHLVEIKNPNTSYGRNGLNDLQTLFADTWRGESVFILETLDDVARFGNGEFDTLKQFPA